MVIASIISFFLPFYHPFRKSSIKNVEHEGTQKNAGGTHVDCFAIKRFLAAWNTLYPAVPKALRAFSGVKRS